MSEVSATSNTTETYNPFVLCLSEFLSTTPTWSFLNFFFFKRKTWRIQFSLEADNGKAKTIFKKRTGTSTRSTPLEKTPTSSKNHCLFQEQCYSSPHPKILTLSYSTWKQTLTLHWAQKWNYTQCKCFVCNQHLTSLGVPTLPSMCYKTEPWLNS